MDHKKIVKTLKKDIRILGSLLKKNLNEGVSNLQSKINELGKKKNINIPKKKTCSPCEKRRRERERLRKLNKKGTAKPCRHCPK